MTDFTTPALMIPRRIRIAGLPRAYVALKAPLALFGRAVATVLSAYGRALELAYVVPYLQPGKGAALTSDDDLNGRDPNW